MNNLLVKIASAVQHPDGTQVIITNTDTLLEKITSVFQFFFGIVIALSTIFLLYASFQYIIARGDEGKVEKAKDTIIWAVVALIVAVLAWSVPTIIANFFGFDTKVIK